MRAVRIVGSSVLAAALVAAGRASAFVIGVGDGDAPKPWDWCAAACLVREAGGVMRSVDARRHAPGGGSAPTAAPAAATSTVRDDERPEGEDSSEDNDDGEFDLFSKSCVCAATPELADELQRIVRQAIAARPDGEQGPVA